ncbi:MAG: HAMP domain-containing histidine kinase [Heliobacteriaceae bacterium]|jgi:signal transduction histidine kinase|nr:HAMP domain-containing histidine kinase [Heliobacteriaceae bacterium]
MIRILFVSDREEIIQKFRGIFDKNGYEFSTREGEIAILDSASASVDLKKKAKALKSQNSIVIFLGSPPEKELEKFADAYLTEDMPENLVFSVISAGLNVKNSLDKLSNTNKDLADSLYRLNALYDTSSNFAGTLDKEKLIKYMIEGMDKALSFSLTCTLSFTGAEPVLLLNSLYEISDELLSAIKLRAVLNYKSLFDGKELPYKLEPESLKVIKTVKYPANRFTFALFQYDNMFAPIATGDNFFGCVEIFKETPFSAEDATSFQTTAQQVSLPLRNAALYQEIIETNEKLEKLERLKSEFISIVSHELRTPLTSIKNSLDILVSGKCGQDSADKFITMAQRNVKRLGGIINDLLDLSKIEAGKMDFHFTDTNIHAIIEYVKSTFSEIANSRNIKLVAQEAENLPGIYADPQRLEQVLTNLVSNAIKFTPEGKTVKIKSALVNSAGIKAPVCFEESIAPLSGDYILVSVEDEGIGLHEKDFLHAFDKFSQIENSLSRKVGGTGLGLPIAQQLVEAHKGVIWCESEPEKGSQFHFAIPAA